MDVDMEKLVKEAVQDHLMDCAGDLIADMVHNDPVWWAERVTEVVTPALKKALQDTARPLLKQIITEMVREYIEGSSIIEDTVQQAAEELVSDMLAKRLQITLKDVQ